MCCLLIHLEARCSTPSPTIYHIGSISYCRCVCNQQCVRQTEHLKDCQFCNPDRGVPTTVCLPDIPHLSSVLIRKISKQLMFPTQIIQQLVCLEGHGIASIIPVIFGQCNIIGYEIPLNSNPDSLVPKSGELLQPIFLSVTVIFTC